MKEELELFLKNETTVEVVFSAPQKDGAKREVGVITKIKDDCFILTGTYGIYVIPYTQVVYVHYDDRAER